jgi:DNA polymerase II small subunit/DNA polymerase delta subunit B
MNYVAQKSRLFERLACNYYWMKVHALFISDCHLGSEHCNHQKLAQFLSEIECKYLYIVGDFIDG